MAIEIAPALEPEEWAERRSGVVSLDAVFNSEYVVIQDADGDRVTVSGPNEIFALIALANDALPDGDPRKITHADVAELEKASGQIEYDPLHFDTVRIGRLAQALAAMLPPQA